MPKIGTYIATLLEKAGLDPKDVQFKDVVGIGVELPDEVTNKLDETFLTIDTAKNNAVLKAHFRATALNPFDQFVDKKLGELGFDDATIAEIKSKSSTYDKIPALLEKAIAATTAKERAAAPDKEAFKKEIDKLNAQILAEKSTWEQKVKDAQTAAASEIENVLLESSLVGKPWVYKEIPEHVNISTALATIKAELEAKGAIAVRDGKSFKLMQKANPELAYMEGNKEVPYTDFTNKTLANAKLLQVTPAGPPAPPNPPVPPAPGSATVDVTEAVGSLEIVCRCWETNIHYF